MISNYLAVSIIYNTTNNIQLSRIRTIICSDSELILKILGSSRGRWTVPLLGLCLHVVIQANKTGGHTHAASGIRTCDRSVPAVQDRRLA
jgi:hypothetical protein